METHGTDEPDNWTQMAVTGGRQDDPSVDAWLRPVLYAIRLSFLPIIVAGTVTNCLNFVVLSHREMRSVSTSVYLFALAVADLGVMYFELFRIWFEWSQIVPPESFITHPAYCRAANYANGVARDYANWLVACLTLERVVRIASPYCARRFCTPRRARLVVLVLFAVICVPHVHALVFSRAQKRTDWVCWEDPDSTAGWVLAALVEFIVGYIVVIVVFVLNVILTCMIYRNRVPTPGHQTAGQRRPSPARASSDAYNPALLAGRPRNDGSTDLVGRRSLQNRRLTRTLIGVATVFLVCETPRMISSVVVKFVDRSPLRRIILNASYVLSGVNHAANFFIYIFSSPRFRQLLVESLRRRPRAYDVAGPPGYRQVPVRLTGSRGVRLRGPRGGYDVAGPSAYRQVAVVGDAVRLRPVNASAGGVEARAPARLAVMEEVDLGMSEELPSHHVDAIPQQDAAAGAAAVSTAGTGEKEKEKEKKGAATASEGAESNSTTCGDIYLQINLQLFFATDSQ